MDYFNGEFGQITKKLAQQERKKNLDKFQNQEMRKGVDLTTARMMTEEQKSFYNVDQALQDNYEIQDILDNASELKLSDSAKVNLELQLNRNENFRLINKEKKTFGDSTFMTNVKTAIENYEASLQRGIYRGTKNRALSEKGAKELVESQTKSQLEDVIECCNEVIRKCNDYLDRGSSIWFWRKNRHTAVEEAKQRAEKELEKLQELRGIQDMGEYFEDLREEDSILTWMNQPALEEKRKRREMAKNMAYNKALTDISTPKMEEYENQMKAKRDVLKGMEQFRIGREAACHLACLRGMEDGEMKLCAELLHVKMTKDMTEVKKKAKLEYMENIFEELLKVDIREFNFRDFKDLFLGDKFNRNYHILQLAHDADDIFKEYRNLLDGEDKGLLALNKEQFEEVVAKRETLMSVYPYFEKVYSISKDPRYKNKNIYRDLERPFQELLAFYYTSSASENDPDGDYYAALVAMKGASLSKDEKTVLYGPGMDVTALYQDFRKRSNLPEGAGGDISALAAIRQKKEAPVTEEKKEEEKKNPELEKKLKEMREQLEREQEEERKQRQAFIDELNKQSDAERKKAAENRRMDDKERERLEKEEKERREKANAAAARRGERMVDALDLDSVKGNTPTEEIDEKMAKRKTRLEKERVEKEEKERVEREKAEKERVEREEAELNNLIKDISSQKIAKHYAKAPKEKIPERMARFGAQFEKKKEKSDDDVKELERKASQKAAFEAGAAKEAARIDKLLNDAKADEFPGISVESKKLLAALMGDNAGENHELLKKYADGGTERLSAVLALVKNFIRIDTANVDLSSTEAMIKHMDRLEKMTNATYSLLTLLDQNGDCVRLSDKVERVIKDKLGDIQTMASVYNNRRNLLTNKLYAESLDSEISQHYNPNATPEQTQLQILLGLDLYSPTQAGCFKTNEDMPETFAEDSEEVKAQYEKIKTDMEVATVFEFEKNKPHGLSESKHFDILKNLTTYTKEYKELYNGIIVDEVFCGEDKRETVFRHIANFANLKPVEHMSGEEVEALLHRLIVRENGDMSEEEKEKNKELRHQAYRDVRDIMLAHVDYLMEKYGNGYAYLSLDEMRDHGEEIVKDFHCNTNIGEFLIFCSKHKELYTDQQERIAKAMEYVSYIGSMNQYLGNVVREAEKASPNINSAIGESMLMTVANNMSGSNSLTTTFVQDVKFFIQKPDKVKWDYKYEDKLQHKTWTPEELEKLKADSISSYNKLEEYKTKKSRQEKLNKLTEETAGAVLMALEYKKDATNPKLTNDEAVSLFYLRKYLDERTVKDIIRAYNKRNDNKASMDAAANLMVSTVSKKINELSAPVVKKQKMMKEDPTLHLSYNEKNRAYDAFFLSEAARKLMPNAPFAKKDADLIAAMKEISAVKDSKDNMFEEFLKYANSTDFIEKDMEEIVAEKIKAEEKELSTLIGAGIKTQKNLQPDLTKLKKCLDEVEEKKHTETRGRLIKTKVVVTNRKEILAERKMNRTRVMDESAKNTDAVSKFRRELSNDIKAAVGDYEAMTCLTDFYEEMKTKDNLSMYRFGRLARNYGDEKQRFSAMDELTGMIMKIDISSLDLSTDEAISKNAAKLERISTMTRSFEKLLERNPDYLSMLKSGKNKSNIVSGDKLSEKMEILSAISDYYRVKKLLIGDETYSAMLNSEIGMDRKEFDSFELARLKKLQRAAYYLGQNLSAKLNKNMEQVPLETEAGSLMEKDDAALRLLSTDPKQAAYFQKVKEEKIKKLTEEKTAAEAGLAKARAAHEDFVKKNGAQFEKDEARYKELLNLEKENAPQIKALKEKNDILRKEREAAIAAKDDALKKKKQDEIVANNNEIKKLSGEAERQKLFDKTESYRKKLDALEEEHLYYEEEVKVITRQIDYEEKLTERERIDRVINSLEAERFYTPEKWDRLSLDNIPEKNDDPNFLDAISVGGTDYLKVYIKESGHQPTRDHITKYLKENAPEKKEKLQLGNIEFNGLEHRYQKTDFDAFDRITNHFCGAFAYGRTNEEMIEEFEIFADLKAPLKKKEIMENPKLKAYYESAYKEMAKRMHHHIYATIQRVANGMGDIAFALTPVDLIMQMSSMLRAELMAAATYSNPINPTNTKFVKQMIREDYSGKYSIDIDDYLILGGAYASACMPVQGVDTCFYDSQTDETFATKEEKKAIQDYVKAYKAEHPGRATQVIEKMYANEHLDKYSSKAMFLRKCKDKEVEKIRQQNLLTRKNIGTACNQFPDIQKGLAEGRIRRSDPEKLLKYNEKLKKECPELGLKGFKTNGVDDPFQILRLIDGYKLSEEEKKRLNPKGDPNWYPGEWENMIVKEEKKKK